MEHGSGKGIKKRTPDGVNHPARFFLFHRLRIDADDFFQSHGRGGGITDGAIGSRGEEANRNDKDLTLEWVGTNIEVQDRGAGIVLEVCVNQAGRGGSSDVDPVGATQSLPLQASRSG